MNPVLFFIPFISAFIGWFTIWMMLQFLFHPHKPNNILGITFQGFFPKRQKELVSKIAKGVSNMLVVFFKTEQKLSDPGNIEKLMPEIEAHIDIFLREKLPVKIPMLSMLVGDKTISMVKAVFIEEVKELFPVLMQQYFDTLHREFNPERLIEEQMNKYPSSKLEEIIFQSMGGEFNKAKMIGCVAGFLVGVIQVLLTVATT